MTYPSLLRLLDEAQIKSGLSRYQLAKALGVPDSTVKRILDGTQIPKADMLLRICAALQLQIEIRESR